jgi:hypothetical protein
MECIMGHALYALCMRCVHRDVTSCSLCDVHLASPRCLSGMKQPLESIDAPVWAWTVQTGMVQFKLHYAIAEPCTKSLCTSRAPGC